MKEAIIAFALALVIGSALNGMKADGGGSGSGGGGGTDMTTPSIPIGDDPPPPTDWGGQAKPIDPDMVSNQPNTHGKGQAVAVAPGVAIPKLDEPGFDRDVIKSASPVLVFFTASGSDACQRELLAVEQLAAMTQANLRVVQVDVMSYPALGQQWGAVSVPTFVMFKDGQKVDMASGELDEPSLLALVKKTVPNAEKG